MGFNYLICPPNPVHTMLSRRIVGPGRTARPNAAAGVLLRNFLRDNNAFVVRVARVPYPIYLSWPAAPSFLPSFLPSCSALLWFYNNLAMPPPFAFVVVAPRFDFAAGQKSHRAGTAKLRDGRTDGRVADDDNRDFIQLEFDCFIMTKMPGRSLNYTNAANL